MLSKKPRHILYAVLLITLSIAGTSAIANTKVYELISEVAATVVENAPEELPVSATVKEAADRTTLKNTLELNTVSASAPMFMTIIQGANEEVICPNDG
ncbi:MAG: hypothetical protein AB3N14_00175, partial [Flavobacteriaceae bacterium]